MIINGQVTKIEAGGGGGFAPIVISQTYNLSVSGSSGSSTISAFNVKNLINQAVANLPDGNYHIKIFFISTNSPSLILAMSNFVNYNNIAVTNGEISISTSSQTIYYRKSSSGTSNITISAAVQILEVGIE